MGVTRYFYDTEFIDDGVTIELISIGIVASDGREYYAVNADVSQDRIVQNTWLREHVWPSLPTTPIPDSAWPRVVHQSLGRLDMNDPAVTRRRIIADEVKEFLLDPLSDDPTGQIELWADYAAYDHVVLAQLWGSMIALPAGIPMFTHDIQQAARGVSGGLPEQETGQHNALADARHVRTLYEHLHREVG